MKCVGSLCSSFETDFFYPICLETNLRTNTDAECNLSKKIQEVRDDLIRRCRLFEEVFEIDCSDSLDEMIGEMK